jgi:hypothetical protein
MIDISAYNEKLEIALQQKCNPSYRAKIGDELSKTEWQHQLFEIERTFSNIKDEQDFQKYQNSLVKLFNDLYEVITAPGVDDFIGWINEITTDKNNANAKKLRDFLVARYSESSISESIESVNSNKSVLEIENSIFNSLLSDITKELRKDTTSLLSDPSQFENNIDTYFEAVISILEGLIEIKDLYYTQIDQLYTDIQKANNIVFYENLIKAIIEKGQSLKPQNEIEKSQSIISKVKNRISEINKGISILYNSKIASSQDELLKSIFLKLDKEVKYDKGISNALNQFIDETWAEIEGHYIKIKDFFSQPIKILYNPNWNTFAKKGGIISIIDEYNKIANENILTNIQNKSTDEVLKLLKAKAKSIDKYFEVEKSLKSEIEAEFKGIITEFEATSKQQLLENLSVNNQELASRKQEIESNIEGLKGGIVKINATNVISFLKDDFTYVLNNLDDIRSGFETFLQKSGMSDHLAWLESKCDGSTNGSVTAQDLNDPTLLKELLEKGLIKIEIEKTF